MTKQKAALISIFSNTVLIIFKIIAGISMSSVSVISEAIHSGIDLIASVVAYFSIKKAAEPADADHTFGHGKFESISGAFEAILIFLAAGLIVYEAIKKIAQSPEITNEEAGIGVMFVSMIVNIIVSRILFRIAKRTDSIALEADAWHLYTDVFTSAGVFFGLIMIKITDIHLIDPIIGIIVALMIIKAAVDLTRRSVGDLVDKSLPEEEIQFILNIIKMYPQVINYHKLRTRKSGDKREIDIHLKIYKKTSLTRAHELCNSIENDINKKLANSYITIHIEPEK